VERSGDGPGATRAQLDRQRAARRRSVLTWSVLGAAFFGCCLVPLAAALVVRASPALLGGLGAALGLVGLTLGWRRSVRRRAARHAAAERARLAKVSHEP